MEEQTKTHFAIFVDFLILVLSVLILGIAIGIKIGNKSSEEQCPEEHSSVEQTQQVQEPLSDWQIFQMAMIKTESEFDPKAIGKNGDWGIFQITDIYLKELNRIQHKVIFSHEDAFDIEKAVCMFGTMQEYYNPEKDTNTAFRYHNKAGWYKKRVEQNVAYIRRMEEVRRVLQEHRERTYL